MAASSGLKATLRMWVTSFNIIEDPHGARAARSSEQILGEALKEQGVDVARGHFSHEVERFPSDGGCVHRLVSTWCSTVA